MNFKHNSSEHGGTLSSFVAVVTGFLLVAIFVYFPLKGTKGSSVSDARAQERLQNLEELRIQSAELLTTYGWENQEKEIVRLPIDRAMELTVTEWKNPAEARKQLIATNEQANEAPPTPPSESTP